MRLINGTGIFHEVGLVTIFGLIESYSSINEILPRVSEVRYQNAQNNEHHRVSKEQGVETVLRTNTSRKTVLDSGNVGPAGLLQLSNLQDGLFSMMPPATRAALIETFLSEQVKKREPNSGTEKIEVRFNADDAFDPGKINLTDFVKFVSRMDPNREIGFQIWINPDPDGVRRANIVLFFNPRYAPRNAQEKFKEGGRCRLNFKRKENILSYEAPAS